MQSEKIGELAKALNKAQSEIKGAIKDSKNPFFNSKYADLESVWEASREALTKNGLSVAQMFGYEGLQAFLETRLLHISGEWLCGRQLLIPVKNDPQSFGSCSTYARRYGLAAMIGVIQTDDDAEIATRTSIVSPIAISNGSMKTETIAENWAPEDFIMPFGKTKGQRLKNLPVTDIESALKWATEKGKFSEFQDAASQYLQIRSADEIPF